MNSTVAATAVTGGRAARRARRPRFFQVTSALLLLAVLAGFAPTYFLRAATHLPSMHWYLWLHGTVMTSWFVISFVQTSLVAAHRTDLHRRLGVLGAWIAAAVVIVMLYALWIGPRDALTGTSGSLVAAPGRMAGGPFLQGLGGLLLFAPFTATAIALRRKVEIHRRLMLMASVAIIFPAAGRIPIWMTTGLSLPFMLVAIVGGTIVAAYILGLPIALLVYDLVTRRGRPHPATVVTLIAFYVQFAASILLPNTPAVQALIRALE